MLKSFAVVAAVTSVVLAQGSTLIPNGIRQECSSFLTELNGDAQLATCAKALTGALSAFAPGSTEKASAATINSALGAVCSESITTSCPPNLIREKLANFYVHCSPELTSARNNEVVALYDTLYVLSPMQGAICSKDDAANYCLLSATPAEGTSVDSIEKSLYTEANQVVVPNADTFNKYNIPFLFLSPDLPEDKLCQTCTRNVLMSYITTQSDIPYAPGLQSSPLLSKQAALYEGVSKKCGPTFMDSQIKAAGGIKGGLFGGSTSGAAPATELQSLMAVVGGLMTLAVVGL